MLTLVARESSVTVRRVMSCHAVAAVAQQFNDYDAPRHGATEGVGDI